MQRLHSSAWIWKQTHRFQQNKKRTSQRSSGNFLLTKISWRIWARPSFCSALKPRKPDDKKNNNSESKTSRTLAHMYTRIPAAQRVVGVFFKKSVAGIFGYTHVSLWFNSCFIWLPWAQPFNPRPHNCRSSKWPPFFLFKPPSNVTIGRATNHQRLFQHPSPGCCKCQRV